MTPGGGIRGSLAYNPALFTRATVEQLVAGFLAVAEQFAADPGITLDRLRIQSPEQHRLALEQSLRAGDPATGADGPETVVDAFRATVARTPDASALVDAAGTDAGASFGQLQAGSRPSPRAWWPPEWSPATGSPWPCRARPTSSLPHWRCWPRARFTSRWTSPTRRSGSGSSSRTALPPS